MEHTKLKLLRVLDILRETDEEHPYTTNEIIRNLSLYGIEADRKSVLRDISALQDYGYDILLHPDNKRGYYLASRIFEDWELKILMDAAVGANFLTPENSNGLANKISTMTSANGRKTLLAVTPLSTSVKSGDPTTKNAIDVLLTAIRKGKKVGFQYTYTGSDLKKHLRFEGHEYPVSPYAMIWRQDRYYLIGSYGSYDKLSYYRLDRIRNIRVMDEPAVEMEKFLGDNAKLKLQEFVDRNLNNYSGGTTKICLEVAESRIDLIVDTFGPNFQAEKGDAGKLIVRVTINDGWGLTSWLLQNGDCIKILEPQRARDDFIYALKLIGNQYGLDYSQEDSNEG